MTETSTAPLHDLELETNDAVVEPGLPASAFQELGIEDDYLYRLAKQGIDSPTDIQKSAIPLVFEGRDLVARAPTGSGKSAAFLLPILHRIWSDQSKIVLEPGAPRALVLVPTRELAAQLGRMARALQPPKTTQSCEITGGVPYPPQFRLLDRPQPIMIATPGRLIDLMDDQRISLSLLEMLVLDEADRMLEMGFTEALDQVLAAAPKTCQKLLFSATVPRWVEKAANRFLNDPASVEVGARHGNTPQIEQGVYYCTSERKRDVLKILLDDEALSKVVVFVNAKVKADELEKELRKAGIKATSLHGDHNQSTRRKALARFRDDEVRVLVASDVAARGVDLPAVSHVINFDLPRELETYVHRIGRTGRAQQEGVAIALCDHFEMSMIRLIERKQNIEMVVLADELPPKAKRKRDKNSKHLRPEWSNKRQPRRAEEERSDRARDSGFDPDDMARSERGERSGDSRSARKPKGRPARASADASPRPGGRKAGARPPARSADSRKPAPRHAGARREADFDAEVNEAPRRGRKDNAANAPAKPYAKRAERSAARYEDEGFERPFESQRSETKPAGRRAAKAASAEGFGRQDRGPKPKRPARGEAFANNDNDRSPRRERRAEAAAPHTARPGKSSPKAAKAKRGGVAADRAADRAANRTANRAANRPIAERSRTERPTNGKARNAKRSAPVSNSGPVRPQRQARRSYIDDALERAFGRENDQG